MKILFIAPLYYDFSYELRHEMINCGNQVVLVEDKVFKRDYLLLYKHILKRIFKYLFGHSNRKKEKYWKSLFEKNGLIGHSTYDMLFCINGYSLCPLFFSLFQQYSPSAKKVYYLWDSCNLYAFDKFFKYFNACYSFDYNDSKTFDIRYLPMFWIPVENRQTSINTVFFVGTIHSNRYYLLCRIIEQLKEMHIPYYIKLYVPLNNGLFLYIRYFLDRLLKRRTLIRDICEINNGKLSCDFVIREHIPLAEFNRRLSIASHILDIGQPCQTAITPRVMQALAENKKIISTNEWLKSTNIYSASQISIIDRKDPHISKDIFVESGKMINDKKYLLEYRIDNWLNSILRN